MKLNQPPILDTHWEGFELAADDAHRYVWIWQGFNIRLIALPKSDDQWGYEHGWCYPRDPELVAACVAAWEPDTQDEPVGWHKRPTSPTRRAPHRDKDPQYNRARCAHGCYLEEGCRTVNCPEAPGRAHAAEA
ncbi:hypothetical protein ACFRFL_13935 [Streptomyces sp. NPDC056708]|uniref:hypothetical protein n=1 Tax=unclassified Streptomyces TaxID=2593676 RepID=UPI0036C486A5